MFIIFTILLICSSLSNITASQIPSKIQPQVCVISRKNHESKSPLHQNLMALSMQNSVSQKPMQHTSAKKNTCPIDYKKDSMVDENNVYGAGL